ncbi:unnamed protein product [Rotaria socialis]|uniref:Xaa-Pro dipeptidyl-peptidase C-terminal domain-containing protein n=1 Tax=Rotaria socialis TaxID=392032 RepID=A0A821FSQ1_9BILA|nr:unnamed protein product [Rotaria socialis]CAF4658044.1 unnamed protein product [Rotaria socialis]
MSNPYSFTTEDRWLTMGDGVRLSCTLAVPIPKQTDEKFPILLEYRPYRKDDSFYNYIQPTIHYLVRRGFIVANVDIRGTGSSEGVLIEREYTSQELDDGELVVELLARDPRSNGRVGMHGLSWTAFNSLMMATLRHPPALRAIFAAHGSEDLYKNDIHFMDGILHQDEYILSVDHENALPAPLQYIMDEKWIKERFTARPWIDVYLEHQLDGEFWQKHSIKYAYENFTLPAYLLAGFYDGYKDFAMNIYENARKASSKIKVVVGPFVHAMPDASHRNPGPGYDGKAEMVRWFNHWLKDNDETNDIMDEPDITLFMRTSLTTGAYRYESEWPITRRKIQRMFISSGKKLIEKIGEDTAAMSDIDTLEYRPWVGFEGGEWWGSATIDQRPFDEYCLVYDSDLVDNTIEIAGYVDVSLQVSATAPLAHWFVRLEDVDIDGQVWFVTGAALNGAQRTIPSTFLEPNHPYTIKLQLHFTTWTFFPGHRIRVAISNAMYPAFWPSPFSMNTSLYLDPLTTFIDLPTIPGLLPISAPPPPPFTQKQIEPEYIFSEAFSGGRPSKAEKFDIVSHRTLIYEQLSYELLPNGCFISALMAENFTVSRTDPADQKWTTHARQVYVFDVNGYLSIDDIPIKDEDESVYPNLDLSARRHFELRTDLTFYSDRDYFYVNLKRQLFHPDGTANSSTITFEFNGKHKRQFQ